MIEILNLKFTRGEWNDNVTFSRFSNLYSLLIKDISFLTRCLQIFIVVILQIFFEMESGQTEIDENHCNMQILLIMGWNNIISLESNYGTGVFRLAKVGSLP